jgi:ribonuclease E
VPDEPAAAGEDDGAATDITAEEAGRLARLDTPPDIPQPPEPPARTSGEADADDREVAERPFAPPAEEAEPAGESEPAAPAASDTGSEAASEDAAPEDAASEDAASEEERAGAGGGSELQLVNGEGVATLPLPRRRPDEAGADRPEAPLPGERPAPPG